MDNWAETFYAGHATLGSERPVLPKAEAEEVWEDGEEEEDGEEAEEVWVESEEEEGW